MIICAAIKDKRNGKVFSGVRHCYIYEMLYDLLYKIDAAEGFVDEENKFYYKNQLTNICTHYRNLGFAASFHISKSYNKIGDYIEVGNIYLSWGE